MGDSRLERGLAKPAPLTQGGVSRVWAMPNSETFSIGPIDDLVTRRISGVSVDPFARDSRRATYTNDLDPTTKAEFHMQAADFCRLLFDRGVRADTVLFDPPYSPRQISEVYKSIGLPVGTADTQNARLYKAVRDELDRLLRPGGLALSFGWNSAGFGKQRGYVMEELLVVCHGGAHNDTLVVVERKGETPNG